MTPEQCALRDAFLAEMWPTVRQYNAADPLPKRTPSKPRKAGKPRKARLGPRKVCTICNVEYQAAYLRNHVARRHPETVESAVDKPESGAA